MIPATSALDRLAERLEQAGLEVELLLVGGAVMTIVFAADPGTRRGSALLGDRRRFEGMAADVGAEAGLSADWLSAETRRLVGREGPAGGGRDGMHLRVFSPTPEYALALKCAELSSADRDAAERRSVEADVRYLLRLTGISGTSEALQRVGRYFTSRQLPGTLATELDRLF